MSPWTKKFLTEAPTLLILGFAAVYGAGVLAMYAIAWIISILPLAFFVWLVAVYG